MSYLVLARKSRPQNFSEVVGQETVVKTLQNALTQNRVPHALIFSGVRGTGKTTLARIMAKAINCEQASASEPCNTCQSCRAITAGSAIDLQEVDGASNRGIQEIRELKEKIRFMPTSARYKIIIIDEVHMLTMEAFNALLKTLEEPPDHVYFMFATTELHKVPVTILSRCQRYELKRLSLSQLTNHFSNLATKENVVMEAVAVDMIAREAGGSVRDGLSLLDQVFSYCGEDVKASDVLEILGLVGHQAVSGLAEALLKGDLDAVYGVLDQVYSSGMDLKRLTNDLLSWFRNLIVAKISGQPEKMLDLPGDEIDVLIGTASQYSLETLASHFNLLLTGFEKVHYSSQPRLTMELVFIQAVQVKDVVPVTDLLGKLDDVLGGMPVEELQNAVFNSHKRASVPQQETTPPVPHSPPVPQPDPALLLKAEPQPSVEKKPAPNQIPEEKPAKLKQSIVTTDSTNDGAIEKTGDGESEKHYKKDIRKDWDGFIDYVRERKAWMTAILNKCSSREIREGRLILMYEDNADCSLLQNKGHKTLFTEFVLDYFQDNLTVCFEVPDGSSCDVDPKNGMTPQEERKILASDPLVTTAVDIFTGQVGDIRIGPRFRKPIEEKTEVGADAAISSEDKKQ